MSSRFDSSQETAVVRRLLPQVQQVLRALPPEFRARVGDLWRDVRAALRSLEADRQSLQDRLDEARQAEGGRSSRSVTRLLTSQSVQQRRFDRQAQMDLEFIGQPEASATVERIWDLDPIWVTRLLERQRDGQAEQESLRGRQLGCWMSQERTGHPYGYTKINLRNTKRPGTNVEIGVQPYRHQLAIVAAGLGQNLVRTTRDNSTDEVSHLCGNHRCFNPDHVVVEPKAMNRQRWACGGAWIVRTADGTVYNPCPHRAEAPWRECILPRRQLPAAGGYYQNSAEGPIQHGA
ncbi:zinc-binding loop region of homing endonuclease [Penicillium hispanicum]|nr:zinc-binding loop region of homing endonuclease [Penicillium hispanicum]KAJ5577375.1 zinc-binding loop region of homing endonuclease [Penicillium hispanicum]KAJ5577381.1 zinc-binding loop region of homing endonuclease [Penicillium hispanicum]